MHICNQYRRRANETTIITIATTLTAYGFPARSLRTSIDTAGAPDFVNLVGVIPRVEIVRSRCLVSCDKKGRQTTHSKPQDVLTMGQGGMRRNPRMT